MIRLTLLYFGHNISKLSLMENALMLGKVEEGRRRGQPTATYVTQLKQRWLHHWKTCNIRLYCNRENQCLLRIDANLMAIQVWISDYVFLFSLKQKSITALVLFLFFKSPIYTPLDFFTVNFPSLPTHIWSL